MERVLATEMIEGEIGVVIDYSPGETPATNVLQAALNMIEALDGLDSVLLSSINTSLEPVSVLNDVQHSSLKILLARVLKKVPDELVSTLDWKTWVGGLLVKGKYKLLQKIDADAPEVQKALDELADDYKVGGGLLVGFYPPSVSDVMDALDDVAKARNSMAGYAVKVETPLGDVLLPDASVMEREPDINGEIHEVINNGIEYFRIKSPDMLGSAQWTVQRNKRSVKAEMLHKGWLDAYHQRKFAILPGDSLKCRFEERILYDQNGTEIERKLAIIEVQEIISPPLQSLLL